MDMPHADHSAMSENEGAVRAVELTDRHGRLPGTYAPDGLGTGTPTIHRLFEGRASRDPEALAALFGQQSLTYGQLNAAANQLARYLINQGMNPGARIALLMPRGPQFLVAQLASLKAGITFVPLDAELPALHQRNLIEDCAASWLLTDSAARLSPSVLDTARCFVYDEIRTELASVDGSDVNVVVAQPAPAYLMYTSSADVRPAAVIVPHDAVVHLAAVCANAWIGPTDCVCHHSNTASDAATFEVWGALLNGAHLAIVPEGVELDAQRFADFIRDRAVTLLWLHAGLLAHYIEALLPTVGRLRHLITGGGNIEPRMLERLCRESHPRSLLLGYGPTECTMFTTISAVSAFDVDSLGSAIGVPLPGMQVYLLDEGLLPVSPGAVGDIWIGGAGVALGYYNRPELTARRFVADPFSERPGRYLFRSEDSGRQRADGSFEIVQRNDDARVTAGNVRDESPSQKSAPDGPLETMLAEMWQEILHVKHVGRDDNFFSLGAHSLSVVQLMARLRRVGLSVGVQTLFQSETLARLARALSGEHPEEIPVPPNGIVPGCQVITSQMLPLISLSDGEIASIAQRVPGGAANVQDIYPLAPLQEGLLFHHLLDGQVGDTYIVSTLLCVSSRQRLEELLVALDRVIARHDILRTAILWEQLSQPVQVVYRKAHLSLEGIELDRHADPQTQLREFMRPERLKMDLRRAPMMRLRVAADPHSDEWYVLFDVHHIVYDASALRILVAEIVAHLEGRAQALPEPIPYRTHVAQALEYNRRHPADSFFRERLADVEQPSAPFGLLNVHGQGTQLTEARATFEPELGARVRQQARRLGVSVATLFHSAWALLVAKTSAREDVVFGSVLLGRFQGSTGGRQVMGMFINTLPLRLSLQGVSARQLVDRTQRELVALFTHEQASLAVAQRCSGLSSTAPLFSAVLNYRHDHTEPQAQWSGAEGVREVVLQYRTNYPISLAVDDLGTQFALTAQTDRLIAPQRVINYLQQTMQSLISALESAPQTAALSLAVLPAPERDQVIERFNAKVEAYPEHSRWTTLFEAQVQRTPQTVAVVHDQQLLTYAELNSRANRLSHCLRHRGVGPDQLVGLCVERGLDSVVGLLGILKAGGAYVPLDPEHPVERLAHLIADSAAQVVLTQNALRDRLVGSNALVIALDNMESELAATNADNPDADALGLRADHLAYVIYTSGSTGVPKGVMIEHRHVLALWQGLESIHAAVGACSRVALNASLNFDASVQQLVQLLSGRTVIIVPHDVRRDPRQFLRFLRNQRVEAVDCTPSQLKTWIAAGLLSTPEHTLSRVLVGGEAIDEQLWSSLAEESRIQFFNVYGPTECAVDVTCAQIRNDRSAPHLGRPMSNRRIYILDQQEQPVPIGVEGEIHVAGAGIARGYWNRPDMTTERFVKDPFNETSEARMYKTGDRGRWRPDGSLEYLGRGDSQVKIRGYRLELGEIEAQLRKHPLVKEVAVIAQKDLSGEERLLACVVANSRSNTSAQDAGTVVVSEWQKMYESTYLSAAGGPSFMGWDSSYTGRPIPQMQMKEWLDCTVSRIRSLRPSKVLEVGCGVGLVLQHLAPNCDTYIGTDFSQVAVARLREWLSPRPEFNHVQLFQRDAAELRDWRSGTFDTIVINSVVQYFPNVEYLLETLHVCIRLVRPGGRIFLGDIRHLGSLPTFHSAVQLGKAGASVRLGSLKQRITRSLSQEKELVVDPQLFETLAERMPGVGAVDVQLKRGRFHNELTRYRYDVVLHVGDVSKPVATEFQVMKWGPDIGSLTELENALRARKWKAVWLHSFPNARLSADAAARALIENSPQEMDAGTIRARLKAGIRQPIDPEDIWDRAKQYGYGVKVSWDPDDEHCFQVILVLDASDEDVGALQIRRAESKKPWAEYVNSPLESNAAAWLIPLLREHLGRTLPQYMVPASWTVLQKLPLTPSGKLDRRALQVSADRPEEIGEYVEAATELERAVAEIWSQVLRVDQVGVGDNFFNLGGHSLLATQVVARISATMSIEIPMRLLFDYPTVKELVAQLEKLRDSSLRAQVGAMSAAEVQELLRNLRVEGARGPRE